MDPVLGPGDGGHVGLTTLLVAAVLLAGCVGADDGATAEPTGDSPTVAPAPGGSPDGGNASGDDDPEAGGDGGTLGEGAAGSGGGDDGDASGDELSAGYQLTGFAGAEPTMGVTSDGTLWLVAGDRMVKSTDEGLSWSSSWKFAPEDDDATGGSPVTDGDGVITNHDPMMWVDPVTDRVYWAGNWPAGTCTYLTWTDDGGQSWVERGPTCPGPPMDHQKLVTGPVPPSAPPVAGREHPTVAYLCYATFNLVDPDRRGEPRELSNRQTRCGVSYDGGRTWTVRNVAAVAAADGCAGLLGQPDVSRQGTVALPIDSTYSCPGPPRVAVSEDTGLSWRLLKPPVDQAGRADDPMTRFVPNGTLWMAYTARDNRTYVVGTPDLGQTWYGPHDVTPPEVNSTIFNALGVGSDGRLAVAYLGTGDTDTWADGAPDGTRWHLHVSAVADATAPMPRIRHVQATPAGDPVQVGRICTSGVACAGEDRNLLDFVGSALGPDGTFYVSYTEGCVDACSRSPSASGPGSRASQAAVAWLDGWFGDG